MTPLAELHVHLEGTAPPELTRQIAKRNGLEVPDGTIGVDGRYLWDDFLHFLRVYDRAASVIRSAQDYRDITFEYLSGCAAEGAIYVELTASPDHARLAGLPYPEQVAGIAQGIDDARAGSGIEARVIVTAVRNFGTEQAERVAALPARHPHAYVTGFGLAGDEAGFPPEPFAGAFALAADAGLGLTVHAGEWAGPESVRGGLTLPVTRIGHGVRAIEEPALVAELAERTPTTPRTRSGRYATQACASRSAPTILRTGRPASEASTPWRATSSASPTQSCASSPAPRSRRRSLRRRSDWRS